MRTKLLGTIAAVAAGAGAASAQSPGAMPPPPTPIAPLVLSANGVDPIGSPGMGMPGPGMGMPGPGMGGPGGMGMGGPPSGPMGGSGLGSMDQGLFGGGGGMPGYPPGTHGQPGYQLPQDGVGPGGVNARLAPRAWFDASYLLWFAKSQRTGGFPLLTTSGPAAGGVPGNTSTTELYPRGDIGYGAISGFRLEGGRFTDDASRYGYYLSGFYTQNKKKDFDVASDVTGQPLIARPFINASTGRPDVLLVSFPTAVAGTANVHTETQLYGAEGGTVTNLYRSCPDQGCLFNLNFITAFRFLELSERLTIDQSSTILDGNTTTFDGKLYGPGTTIGVRDDFETHNRFYGGQVGLNGEARYGRCFLGVSTKVAIGVMDERLDVRGFSTLQGGGTLANSTAGAGLFANANNVGRYKEDKFAVIPELTVNLGYTWRSWLTTSVGYNLLYASRVARPGEQVNPVVNSGQVPTSPAYGLGSIQTGGSPSIVQSDYYMQGVQFSLMIRY